MAKAKELRIILVDDNNIDIVVNTKLLKIANITNNVVSFHGCQEVLEYFKKRKEEILEMRNVVLMDIQMPDYDGFECIDLLQEHYPELSASCSFFMLSSSIDRGDIRRAEENKSILKVLEKPLDVYQLKGLIEQ